MKLERQEILDSIWRFETQDDPDVQYYLYRNGAFGPGFWALVVIEKVQAGYKEEENHFTCEGGCVKNYGNESGEYVKEKKNFITELTREEAKRYFNLFKIAAYL